MKKLQKAYENNDLMMYLKKRYCHCCGGVLKHKKTERIVKKGDSDYIEYRRSLSFPKSDILVIGKEYYCSSCDKTFSCAKQGEVIEAQKYYQRKIVTDEEIRQTYKNQMLIAQQNILKLRWTLLIPGVGSAICIPYIISGKLSAKVDDKDMYKMFYLPFLTFLAVGLIAKFVLSMFNDVDLINNYRGLFILIPSLLAANIPTLWYINRIFKD